MARHVYLRSKEKKSFNRMYKAILALLMFFSFATNAWAQPNWVGTPNISNIKEFEANINFQLNQASRVYIIVYDGDFPFTSADVKLYSGWAELPYRPCTDQLVYGAGDVGSVMTFLLDNLQANKNYWAYIVAEDIATSTLQAVPIKLPFTTLPCPPITLFTFFGNLGECVNLGATGVFQAAQIGAIPTGVLKGTVWQVNWGDGTPVWSYTSAFDNDTPPIQNHTYVSLTNCNYVGQWGVMNPCGQFLNGSNVFVVHGRDIPTDGDGVLQIVDNSNGSTVIEICEGLEATVVLRDNSTWNCQNPTVPFGVPAPNNSIRNLQWYYGQNPAGGVTNTITGDVTVSSLGTANAGGGVWDARHAPTPMSVGELSEVITIPATSVAGQYFRVYLKNWNKCNWTDPSYVDTFIDIVIIDAPPAPIVTTPQEHCFGSVPATITATKNLPTNTLNWYDDAALSIFLATGDTYTHGETAVGSYDYWVTETGGVNGCEGPAAYINLKIREPLTQPGAISGPAEVCLSATAQIFSVVANPPVMPVGGITEYVWSVPAGWNITAGQGTRQITVNIGGATGNQTVSVVNNYTSVPNCPSTSRTFSVFVSPLSVGGSITGGTTPMCIGANTGVMTLSGHTGSVVRWERRLNAGGWVNIVNVTTTHSEVPASVGTWEYRVLVQSGSCSSTYSAIRIIIVDPTSVGGTLSGGSTPICLGSNTGVMTLAGYTGNIVRWERRVNAGGWVNIANTTTTHSEAPASAGTWEFRVRIQSGSCAAVYSTTRTIVVDPTSVGGSITGGSTPICIGSNTGVMTLSGHTGSVVRWERRVNAGGWVNIINTTTTYSEIPASAGTWEYRARVQSGTCSATYSAIRTIVVDPASVGGTVSGGSTPICLGTNTGVMTLAGHTGSIVRWERRLNAGGWVNIANNTTTHSEVPASAGTWDYRVRIQSGSCSATYSTIRTIIVDPTSVGGAVSGGATPLCIGSNTGIMTLAGHTGSVVRWERRVNAGGWANIANTTTTHSEVPASAGTWEYRAYVQSGTCSGTYSTANTIVVNPTSVGGSITGGTTPLCFNVNTGVMTLSGHTGSIVRWEKRVNAGVWSNIANNTTTYSEVPSSSGTWEYRAYIQSGACAPIYSAIRTIFLNPQFSLAQFKDNASICNNTATNINIELTGGTSPYTINYTKNGVPQAQLNNYLSGTNFTTGLLFANTTYQLTSVTDATGCNVESMGSSILITVGSLPTSATLTTSGDDCFGATSSINTVIVSGAPPYTISYTRNGVPQADIVNYVSGTDFNLGGLLVGSYTYTITAIEDLCNNFVPVGNLPGSETININPIPNANGTINNTATICNDGTTDIVLHSTVVGTDFSWTVSNLPAVTWQGGKAPVGGTILNGEGLSIGQNLAHDGTSPVTVTYTITPRGPGGTACSGTPITRDVVVNPTAVITSAATQTVCDVTALGYTATSSTVGATFAWTRAVVAGIANPIGGGATATINETLDNTGTAPVAVTYVITPSYGGCAGTPFNFVVTVNPTGQVNQPPDETLCNGSNTTAVTFATVNTGGVTTYSWTNSAPSIGIAATGSGDIGSFAAVNVGTSPVVATIIVTPTFTNGVGCAGSTKTFTITVNPTPTLTTTLTPADVCSNTAFNYNPASATVGTTFNWTRTDVVGITPAGPTAGAGNPNETLINITSLPIAVTYQYTLSANGCDNVQDVVVNIKSEPVGVDDSDAACSDLPIGYNLQTENIDLSGNGQPSIFSWVAADNLNVTGESTAPMAGAILTDAITNVTGIDQDVVYTVTPTGTNGCTGNTFQITVTIQAEPEGANDTDATCSDVALNYDLQANIDAGNGVTSDFTWIAGNNPNVTGESTILQSGDFITDNITNTSGSDQIVIYTVTPTATAGCEGDPFTITVTVRPEPVIQPFQFATVCSAVSIDKEILLIPANTPAGTTFSWPLPLMSAGPAQGTIGVDVPADPAGSFHITDILSNFTGADITATYSITPTSAFGCEGTVSDVVITVNSQPTTSDITGESQMCLGATNKVYSVINTPGSTYAWTIPGHLTPVFNTNLNFIIVNAGGTGSGNVEVTETNSNGCVGVTKILPVTVSSYTIAETVSGLEDVCVGDAGVNYSVPENAGSTYAWTVPPGVAITTPNSLHEIDVTFNLVTSGNFTVIETNTSGCVTVHNPLTVTVHPTPNIYNLTAPTYYCFGDPGVTLTLSNSESDVYYQLMNGAVAVGAAVPGDGNPIFWLNNLDGSYYVEAVRDAVPACSRTMAGVINVTANPAITMTTDLVVDVECFGSNEGEIYITPAGGTSPYTFLWTGPGVYSSTNEDITGLYAGDYTVTITDVRGCTYASASITVSEPAQLTLTSVLETQPVTCFGDSDGEAEVVVDGATGTAPYSYQWYYDPGFSSPVAGANASTLAGVPAATYYILVTDANFCTVSGSVIITQPALLVLNTTGDVALLCNGATTASGIFTVTGGTAPFGFNTISNTAVATINPAGAASIDFTNGGAGVVIMEVVDGNGCSTQATITITEPAAISVTASLSVSPEGSHNIGCAGGSNGSIQLTVFGGTFPYIYAWTTADGSGLNPADNGTQTGLTAGTYDVTITDFNGCQFMDSYTLTEPPALSLTVSADDYIISTCPTSVANLTGVAGGGVELGGGGYLYSWSPASGLSNPNVLSPQAKPSSTVTYTLTITDANGCNTNDNLSIEVRPALTAVAFADDNLIGTCVTSVANLDVNVNGGEELGGGGYTYSWVPAASLDDPNIKTPVAKPAVTTTYTVTVTDANGCTAISNVTITVAPDLAVTASTSDALIGDCPTSTAQLDATVTGGEGGYTYLWNNAATLDDPAKRNPVAKPAVTTTYTVTVTDANGCATTDAVVVDVALPLAAIASTDDDIISTCPASVANLDVAVSGGEGVFTYSWSQTTGLNNPFSKTPVAKPAATTTYTVTVTDRNGCVTTSDVTITVAAPIVLTHTALTYNGGWNISCRGESDGEIDLTIAGGEGTYVIAWSGPGGFTSTDEDITALLAGAYMVTVTDINGCIKTANIVLTEPANLIATAVVQSNYNGRNISCNGASDGAINLTVTGGTTLYTFAWTGPGAFTSTDEDPSGLVAGAYNVTVTDANGCTTTASITLTEPAIVENNPTNDQLLDCFGDSDGYGTFYAQGGTMPYTFTEVLNTAGATYAAPGINSQSIFSASAGVVTVRVTDANGCWAEATITFTEPAPLTPGVIGPDQEICNREDPGILAETVAPTGGSGAYSYQWQMSSAAAGPYTNLPGATAATYDPPSTLSMTTYFRREIRSGICTPEYSNPVEIIVNPLPNALLTGGETICPGDDAILKVTMFTGVGPYDVELSDGTIISPYNSGDDIIVSPGVTTTYTLVSVRDLNGCDAPPEYMNGQATVTVRALPVITADPVNKTICEYNMTSYAVTATGSDLTYQWQADPNTGSWADLTDVGVYFGATNSTLMLFSADRTMNSYRYRAIVTGCSVDDTSAVASLTVNTSPGITGQPKDTLICMGAGAFIDVDAEGTGLSYRWYVNRNDGSGFVAVNNDANFSGALTDSLVIVNAPSTFNNWFFRVVIGGSCGVPVYSSFAVLNVISPPTVTLQPLPKEVCEQGNVYFTASGFAPGLFSMKWQVDDGGGWVDVDDDANYLGSASPQLTILDIPFGFDQNSYRLALIGECTTTNSNGAILTVNANPVVDFSAVDPMFACGGVNLSMNGNPTGGSGVYSIHRWTGQVGPLSNFMIVDPVFNTSIPGTYDLTYTVTDNKGCTATDDVSVDVERPIAMFNPDVASGCPPLTINFTDLSTNGSIYRWDFGDGSPVDNTAGNVSHVYSNASTSLLYYNVTLEVETVNGCKDDQVLGVTIYPQADSDFDLSADTICSGDYVILSSQPGAWQYYWEFGDGQATYGAPVINHLYVNSGTIPVTYTIRLTTTSFYSCAAWIEKDIVVYPTPIPMFSASPPSQTFPAATVSFTNATNAGTWSYLWRFGDNTTSVATDPVHTYTAPGNYNVKLIVNNSQCIDSVNYVVNILPTAPIADFDSIPGACAPYTVTFSNNSLYETSYTWEFGDGSISHAENPTYTYLTGGIYRVRLTVAGPGGTDYMEKLLTVFATPRAYFEAAPDSVFVDDESVRFFNLSVGADYYIWEFGDGDTAQVRDPSHKYMAEGMFPVTLHAYSSNGCYDTYQLLPGIKVIPAGVIRFATVFRPNSDGPTGGDITNLPSSKIDQVFFPPVKEQVDNYKLQIFNRSGVLLFESRDINIGWDGYYKGKLSMQGVYVWYVEGNYANGKPFKKTGDITLLH